MLVGARRPGRDDRPVRGLRAEEPGPLRPPAEAGDADPARRSARCGIARKQLGVPYRYGGASPSGFDCSGLVSWVYGRLGVSLPHNAAALYGVGRPVSRRKLRPGDLVFFSGLGHVGLYIGRGRMIHAPQSGRARRDPGARPRDSGSIVGARRVGLSRRPLD